MPVKMNPTELADAVAQYEELGYTMVRGAVDVDRLAELDREIIAEFDRVRSSGELFKGGGTIAGHLNCFPGESSRFVVDELEASGVLDIVRAVSTGGELGRLRVNCNLNMPGSHPQHYHIDGYYSEDYVSCTIAVRDADERNGALDVLPGTHHRFYKFWQYAFARLWRRSTRVPMQRGDVVVRKSTLWHRGMPNYTDELRLQLTFNFGEGAAPTTDPFLVHDGKITFEPNWFKTDRIGQLRELVFVKAPFSYSCYRFARSLVGNKGYALEERYKTGGFTTTQRRFVPSRWRDAGR